MRQGKAARPVRTDDLIQGLAMEAGQSRAGRLSFELVLSLGIVAAIIGAFAIVLLLAGPRPGLPLLAQSWIFQFKVIAMVLLAGGAAWLVRDAARPGAPTRLGGALAPALLFLAANVVLDRSGYPLSGARALSVPVCVGTIVLASLPALMLMLASMRRGIPTRLGRAGFFAGLLAGTLGALAYTVACVNDGAAFVSVWYVAAILIVAGLGAVAGPRALAW
ncbi:NrsF family protein [Arenibaculum pallidiluteum]|uniref:NrsF family protein n=1 Tax=Arenibaculum pallidiluteum TaxID=2812559 RepID=UPI001A96FE3D|nr:DUF1109 domain-containing protein [Arenibaculum pallidiluteum]